MHRAVLQFLAVINALRTTVVALFLPSAKIEKPFFDNHLRRHRPGVAPPRVPDMG
jgi:hypothetical protein